MKIQELRKLIREEVRKVMNEAPAMNKKVFIFDMVKSALTKNKVMELQKELDDYSIELYDVDYNLAKTNKNEFLKQAKDSIDYSDWNAVGWGDLKSIQKTLGL